MKMTKTILFLIIVLSLFGCVTYEPAQYLKPTYDNSHAILVEETVRDLPIIEIVKNNISTDEKIVIASIETEEFRDIGVNYLIEDNLIGSLTQEGYRVVDRDPHVLTHLSKEQNTSDVYYEHLIKNNPNNPIFTLIKKLYELDLNNLSAVEVQQILQNEKDADFSNFVEKLSLTRMKDLIETYLKVSEEYRKIIEKQINQSSIATADLLLSYRVLECGLWVDIEKDEISREDSNINSTTLMKDTYNRHAVARIFVRLIDAKTGEVRYAKLVENRKNDKVEFQQGENETPTHYNKRMNEYNDMLKNYHFTFYDYQLPNVKGEAAEKIEVLDKTDTEASADNQSVNSSIFAEPNNDKQLKSEGNSSGAGWVIGGITGLLGLLLIGLAAGA